MTKQEFLAMSLPYNLKIKHFDANRESEHICKIEVWHNEEVTISDGEYEYDLLLNDILPILRPLTDLTKEIEHKGEKFIPIVELLKNSSFDTSKMSEKEIMSFVEVYSTIDLIALNDLPLYLQWHFDLFGGIESGEAIDVNTLDINPYK